MNKLLLLAAFALCASPALAQNNAEQNIVGNGNNATAQQTGGADNDAWTNVEGNNNISLIEQSGGDDNDAQISFEGNRNDATIQQIGRKNDAFSEIKGIDVFGDRNHSEIYQEGDFNDAQMRIDGNNNGELAGNALRIRQVSEAGIVQTQGNDAFITLRGDGNDGIIEQDGLGNEANLYLAQGSGAGQGFQGRTFMEADNTTITVKQLGDGSSLSAFVAGNGNEIDSEQVGDNTIGSVVAPLEDGINIYGNSNLALMRQSGSGNEAMVMIEGNNNDAFVYQSGANDDAMVDQVGNGNTSTITQN